MARTEVQKQNIRDWITALRSGEYKQTNGALFSMNYDEADQLRPEYCCLGVAACVMSGETDPYDVEYNRRLGGFGVLKTVRGWTDCSAHGSLLPFPLAKDWYGISPAQVKRLAKMNDGGSTFLEIADYLEKMI
jgi:hypothetical protein